MDTYTNECNQSGNLGMGWLRSAVGNNATAISSARSYKYAE